MKIAYIIYPDVIISNKSNGIRSQAESWGKMLKKEGVEVDFIDNWGNYRWKDYDVIHFFGQGYWIFPVIKRLYSINNNIVWSPIMDPKPRRGMYHIFSALRWLQSITPASRVQWGPYSIAATSYCKCLFARSEFEKEFLVRAFGASEDKVIKIPLSYSQECKSYTPCEKENFCLHISSIYQKRKNVLRLIEAAKKYQFKLVLAGNKGTENQYAPIKEVIGNCHNIEVLGFISDEEKIDLYKRAKVFALPSIYEGVGIVALDAAFYGCEIVITNIPGPKEYYSGNCMEVSPYDTDEIGKSIKMCLEGKKAFQPRLGIDIANKYSGESIVKQLLKSYETIVK